ncbi:MAG: hypothetical protein UR50_C0015G0016 [Parcubacteria group bacterium GW2011_GWC1_34_10]|nr:MAG: hypothetical protein UR50_C0015G0016 [Parcubacteria group bacterium GW2011_GWC1_34_10]
MIAAEKVNRDIRAIGAITELLPTLKTVPEYRMRETMTIYEIAKKALINGILLIFKV